MQRNLTREYLIYKEGDFENQLRLITDKIKEISATFKVKSFNVDFEDVEMIIRMEGTDK